MSWFDSILLGVVQGLTEFIPVSSTGHLILARDMLGLPLSGLAFDAALHLATACAVLAYFFSDIRAMLRGSIRNERGARVLLVALVAGTVPALIAGFFLEETMDTMFRNIDLVAYALIAGSLLFVLAEKLPTQQSSLTVWKGIAVGCFQALALIPGLSRSGMSISGGLLLGLPREQAVRFAFLLSFPIILGAGTKKLLELASTGYAGGEWFALFFACAAAFISGLVAIHFMVRFLRTRSLMPFVYYRLALAALILLVL